ncbi:hypothetical protein JCM8097_007553 [Rhodosporidiobolus ruineniae]
MASAISSFASSVKSTRTRTDEEDKHVEEGAEDVKASPFDRLPDEVLSLVLDFALAEFSCPASAILALLVSRRFYALARPLAYHSVDCCDNETFESLVRRRDLHAVPHKLSYRIYKSELGCALTRGWAMISLYDNLATVDLASNPIQSGKGGAPVLPSSLTDTLSRLLSLSTLKLNLCSNLVLEDPAFSIGNDLPRLRQVELRVGKECGLQLLEGPMPRLQRIALSAALALKVISKLPWSSLTGFELTADGETSKALLALGRHFRALVPALKPSSSPCSLLPPLPLTSFAVSAAPKSAEVVTETCLDLISNLLNGSYFANVVSLDLSISSLPTFPPFAVKSLQSLRFRTEDNDYSQPAALLRLCRFLSTLPQLHTLVLVDFDFSPSVPRHKRALLNPESDEFLQLHPALHTFVSTFVCKSAILRFDWTDRHDEYVWRWVRRCVREEFQVDRYEVFERGIGEDE